MPHDQNTSEMSLAVVIDCCRRERQQALRGSELRSPCCVEIVRRAFRADQEAWAALRAIFEPLMLHWARAAGAPEPEDALQDGLLQFARYAPATPDLAVGAELGRALAYLRSCIKTAALGQRRQQQRRPPAAPLDPAQAAASPRSLEDELTDRLALHQLIATLLPDPLERLVFRLYFELNLTAAEICAAQPDRLADASAVYLIVQRIKRRLRTDPGFQGLRDSA